MNPSYKKLMETRLKIMIIAAVGAFVAVSAAFALRILVFTSGALPSKMPGVLSAFIAFEVVLIIRIIQYGRSLKDNDKLEKMEIEEFDERGRQIRFSASRMAIWLMMVGLGVASLIAYFFSLAVSMTLCVVLLVLLLLYGGLKLMYAKIL